jgi:heptosyltransferase I
MRTRRRIQGETAPNAGCMTEILFIKTSSMGDVLHHMPAVTDARRRFPAARFTWVVDELYAPLASLHPAVDEVVPIAVRRWRKQLFELPTWNEVREATAKLRAHRYDAVIDTQGLVRTALMTKLIDGTSHGYDSDSIREPFATRFYDNSYTVSRDLHAIARNRTLTGLALGYHPEGEPDYSLNGSLAVSSIQSPYAVLLHATSRTDKEWPEDRWIEVGKRIAARDLKVLLPWGNDLEHTRSKRLAAEIPNAHVPDFMPILEIGKLIAGARLVVGVDTGLLHLAAALGVPMVGIYAAARSQMTTPIGPGAIEIVTGPDGVPPTNDVLAAVSKISAAHAA